MACVTYHLSIAGYRHDDSLGSTVENGENGLILILTGDNVYTTIRYEVQLTAMGDNLTTLSPMQQTAQPAKQLLFSSRAALSSESTA